MISEDFYVKLEERFLEELRHHLLGWRKKVLLDFSENEFKKELKALQGDQVYQEFGFANPQYVLVRLMGRMSISIGRRLGEIYDKIPRFVVQARFGLSRADVAPKFGRLELDVQVPYNKLAPDEIDHVRNTLREYDLNNGRKGIGIEIRYNFNPNDSARLRKDVDMVKHLFNAGLTPIYLIFSSISPRDEAIARLKREGWNFLIGEDANSFMTKLANMDISSILQKPRVQQEIKKEVQYIMKAIYTSYAFNQANKFPD